MRCNITTRVIGKTQNVICRLLKAFVISDGGVAGVEFAILAPGLIMMMICTADIAFGIYYKMRVQNAAQFGSQYAVAHGFNAASITNALVSASNVPGLSVAPAPYQFCGCATSSGVDAIDCNVPCPNGASPGGYVTVSIQGTYNTFLPYPLLPRSYAFASQSTVRVQ